MLATATRTGPRSAATSLAKRCLVLAGREACTLAGRLGRARKGGEVEELYRTAGWGVRNASLTPLSARGDGPPVGRPLSPSR